VPTLERVKLADIKLDEKNANRGTRRGREFLEMSLSKYGLGRSMLLDKDGKVIAGNKTLEAYRTAGGKEIVIIGTHGDALIAVQREDLTINSRKGRSLAIADNRPSEIGLDWDPKILVSLDVKLGELFDDRGMRQILGDLVPIRRCGRIQLTPFPCSSDRSYDFMAPNSAVPIREYRKTIMPAPTSGIPASAKTRKAVGCDQRRAASSTASPRNTRAAEIRTRLSITCEDIMELLSRASQFRDWQRYGRCRGIRC
jgi:hypothetical protein